MTDKELQKHLASYKIEIDEKAKKKAIEMSASAAETHFVRDVKIDERRIQTVFIIPYITSLAEKTALALYNIELSSSLVPELNWLKISGTANADDEKAKKKAIEMSASAAETHFVPMSIKEFILNQLHYIKALFQTVKSI